VSQPVGYLKWTEGAAIRTEVGRRREDSDADACRVQRLDGLVVVS